MISINYRHQESSAQHLQYNSQRCACIAPRRKYVYYGEQPPWNSKRGGSSHTQLVGGSMLVFIDDDWPERLTLSHHQKKNSVIYIYIGARMSHNRHFTFIHILYFFSLSSSLFFNIFSHKSHAHDSLKRHELLNFNNSFLFILFLFFCRKNALEVNAMHSIIPPNKYTLHWCIRVKIIWTKKKV